MSELDADLLSAARVLDGSLRGFRLPQSASEANYKVDLPFDVDRRLSLPRNFVEADDEATVPYFAIWLRGGQLLKSTGPFTDSSVAYDWTFDGKTFQVQQRGDCRELRIVGPSGTQILVGRNINNELEALRRLAIQIVAISFAILIVGLIGGWWLSRSVIRPIHIMSETASQFSVTDMSPRIDVVETESELGELATILNAAFSRVQSSFAQQQQFAADASHELRTPLAVIQSQIELALKKERTSEDYIKALTTCAAAEERLSELVESLLTLARIDSGDQQFVLSPIRLDLIAAKCTDLMRPIAEQAEVDLNADVQPSSIQGNSQQLERAILNLIRNGITYNHPGGSVQVEVDTRDSVAILTIRDTGIGINEEDLVRVTKRFFRVDKARSRQQGGSGLGLSIAEEIIKAHDGAMQISSEPNVGTTVTILFGSNQ